MVTRDRGGRLPELLLDLVRDQATITRGALVEQTGWARTVVTQRLMELIDVGLVADAGAGRSTGGRAPRELRFVSEAGAVVGVGVDAASMEVAVTDLAAREYASHHEPWDVARGPEATLHRLETLIWQVIAESPVSRSDVVGIGVGLPGPVEFATGCPVTSPVLPGWAGFPVRDWLAERFGVEVVVDNDANAMALAEQRLGLARGVDDFVFVKVGEGISAGVVSNGRLHRGADGAAGDIGHIAVEGGSSQLCRCGRYGCLEAYASGAALGRQAQEAAANGTSPYLAALARTAGRPLMAADVTAGAFAGDATSLQLITAATRRLGMASSGFVNFFNPALIVYGGGATRAGDLLLPGIRQTVLELSLPLATRSLQIDITHLGDRVATAGAALAVVDELMRADRFDWWAARRQVPAPA